VVTRCDNNDTNIAAHDQRLDNLKDTIDELRNEAEDVIDINPYIGGAVGCRRELLPSTEVFCLGQSSIRDP
jgi:hypothetical protein